MPVKGYVSGTYSCLDTENTGKYIIKRPRGNSKNEREEWYRHQYRAIQFLSLEICTKGVLTPNVLSFSENEVKETFQSGVPLTQDNFEALPVEVQNEVSNRLAKFLAKIHQTHGIDARADLDIRFFKSSIYFSAFNLPKPFLKRYRLYLNLLRQNQHSFRKVLCYRDLKAMHLLYDKEKDNLSVVDFGAVGFDVPLKEFCLDNPIRSDLSPLFIKKTIEVYNQQKPSQKIDINIVKAYLYCAAFNEMASVCRMKKVPIQDIIGLGKILKDFLENLETAFSDTGMP